MLISCHPIILNGCFSDGDGLEGPRDGEDDMTLVILIGVQTGSSKNKTISKTQGIEWHTDTITCAVNRQQWKKKKE